MIKFLKDNKIVILILTIFIFIMWIFSIFSISKEATPSVNIPNYILSVVYPWADPTTVEQQVIRKLENKVRSISYVKNVTSSSANNFWLINIEFLQKKKDVDAINDIKSAIDSVYSELPSDVKYPTFKKVDISDSPIYIFAIWSELPTQELYKFVKPLEEEIKWIQWVSDVNIIWKPLQQVNINIDYAKLSENNLDLSNIVGILKTSLFKIPSDKKNINWNLYSLEVSNYNNNLTEVTNKLSNLDLVNQDWKTIKTNDIWEVISTYAYNKNKSFLITENWAINTLSMQIKKIPWEDIERITTEIKDLLTKFKTKNPWVSVIETFSMEESTNKMYKTFVESFLETAILVFIIILITFWLRSSIVILLWFLISYSITFWFLKSIWYTFNNIVSFSLILVLWIMVDNLIVMTQWVIAWYKSWLTNVWDTVEYSLQNYWKAIIFWTLTTILAFAPLYWMLSWIIWEFMKSFPITVDFNLFVSIIISVIVLPIIFSYIFKTNNTKFKTPKISEKLDHFWEKIWVLFEKLNKNKKRSFIVIISFWWVFIFAIMLMVLWIINTDFMSPVDSDNVWINLKYRAWITIEQNQEFTKTVSNKIVKHIKEKYKNEVETITIDIWSEKTANSLASAMNQWWADYTNTSITLKLFPWEKRDIKSYTITEELQNFLSMQVKWKYEFLIDTSAFTQKSWPWSWKEVSFNVLWNDLNEIWKYVAKILPEIEKVNWIYNVWTSINYTNWKIKYILDEDKAKQLWINLNAVIYNFLALKNSDYQPNWIKITWLNEFWDEQIDIKAFLNYSWDIDNMKIWKWYLSQIIKDIKIEPDMKSIDKVNWQVSITIDSDKNKDVALGVVTQDIYKIIDKYPLPEWMSFKASWDIETQLDSVKDLWKALLLWIALMYLTLVILFKNIKYPTIVITGIFLCVWWIFIILALTWLTFNFPAQLWIFWVFWVWVNQAIIHIIDFTDFHEWEWLSTIKSFKKSISKRFEPIILTKLITIVWLLILAIKDEMFSSMAIAFIWWLIMSLFVTLIYLPTMITFINKD